MYTQKYDRSGPVQGFKCAVWTGPDRPEKFNDGPVWSMNLSDRCISDIKYPINFTRGSYKFSKMFKRYKFVVQFQKLIIQWYNRIDSHLHVG